VRSVPITGERLMSGRVLIVDDIEINVKLLAAKLSSEFFDVSSASSGNAALQIADAEPPDVILLDIMMPRMDGFEVCRRLKANPRTADVPVVMVTALSDTADRLCSLEAGADEFLTKPVNDKALFARVRSLIRLKRMKDEWRLREEICSRLGGNVPQVAEEAGPAQIMIVAEDAFGAANLANTLSPIAKSVRRVAAYAQAPEQLDRTIELVIANLAAPGDDALRFVAHCRAHDATRQLPIVLIAESRDLPHLARGLDLGANDYLVRPVDRSELLARCATQVRRKRLQDRLDESYQRSLSLALTDELTGLYNRRYLFAHLDELIRRANGEGVGATVLLYDIDHFKLVNDAHGHVAGDEVLREIAVRSLESVRAADLVARFGGEEFVVIMPETGLAVAAGVAERLHAAISDRPFIIQANAVSLRLTVSIGVTVIARGDDRDTLLKRADDALYAAKTNGRNRVVIHPPTLSPVAVAS
jgi:two-component system, cell cycle response regulator